MRSKVNALAYFETLCSNAEAANVLVNSSLASAFVVGARPIESANFANASLLDIGTSFSSRDGNWRRAVSKRKDEYLRDARGSNR